MTTAPSTGSTRLLRAALMAALAAAALLALSACGVGGGRTYSDDNPFVGPGGDVPLGG